MILNKEIKKLLPFNKLDKYYVVTDFDRTITIDSSKTSWSILSGTSLVPKSYINERQKLYDKYRPIEIDETMDYTVRSALISEWFKKHIELFVKYQISEELFDKAASDFRVMEFRKGAKRFLKFLYDNQIPLIIISAGIGNFIETFLIKNDCLFNNIYISSNKIIFKNKIAVGVDKNIIHSLNKNEVSLSERIKNKLESKEVVFLLGDQISDLKMTNSDSGKKVIKIGFYSEKSGASIKEFEESFDIVCFEGDDYNTLMKLLFEMK